MNKRSEHTEHIVWYKGSVEREERSGLFNQRGCIIWFTGLSGSGKSTVAYALEKHLIQRGHASYVLDGDNIRHGLNADLGFSPEDRRENIRRIGELAALFADAGLITITAFISPYRADRAQARKAAEKIDFIEVFLDVPLDVCEQRDPKELYKKARAGEISDFTGIDAPYEAPLDPDIKLDTTTLDVTSCVDEIMRYIREKNIIA